MREQDFLNLTQKGTVLLDGAMGSNLMKMGMPKGVCTELWVSEHPDIQREIQSGYVEAGAQIIYAPTFQANRMSLDGFGLADSVQRLNGLLVARAKEAAGKRALVAGDISSTGRSGETYEAWLETYKEQISCLLEAGVDLLVAETMIYMDETMAVLDAAKDLCDLPVICTMTVEADGSLLMGGNVYEACTAYEAMGAAAVGINCSLGPDQLEAIVGGIRRAVSIPVAVKPNAGIPFINEQGEAIYKMGPDEFAGHMMKLVKAGADIVGGCCGTNAQYICALKERLK